MHLIGIKILKKEKLPCAKDIKIYKKDPSKEYNKGDLVAFFRVFENKSDPQIPSSPKTKK